jgi:hypothetical protein
MKYRKPAGESAVVLTLLALALLALPGSAPGAREPDRWLEALSPHVVVISNVLRVDAPDRERSRRVLHEYVHLLTHANVPDLPAWLDEGISEFWTPPCWSRG